MNNPLPVRRRNDLHPLLCAQAAAAAAPHHDGYDGDGDDGYALRGGLRNHRPPVLDLRPGTQHAQARSSIAADSTWFPDTASTAAPTAATAVPPLSTPTPTGSGGGVSTTTSSQGTNGAAVAAPTIIECRAVMGLVAVMLAL
ncbi:hypothetical protein PG994_003435 [Apiospora phragmitis]|uniref:Uncharacterized protein n=1 Tax=Apiospora phragmitis TaxID=2905665 RepID=A0ABR1VY65_9PEZI